MVQLFLLLFAASLIVMVVVDAFLGARAEFMNAYSALQRLAGQVPAAGDSLIARKLGVVGELAVVIVTNLAIGGILTVVVRLLTSKAV